MSRFGVLMVLVALSAGLSAQTTAPATEAPAQGQTDAKSIQPVPPIPWFDPSLANASDRAKMLAISVATVHNCSAGSSAICYGFCAPKPENSNSEPSASRRSTPIKQQSAIKSKPTGASPGN
jgi:hypothetical protein